MPQGMTCLPFLRPEMVTGVPQLHPEKRMGHWNWCKWWDLSRGTPTICMCPQRILSAA